MPYRYTVSIPGNAATIATITSSVRFARVPTIALDLLLKPAATPGAPPTVAGEPTISMVRGKFHLVLPVELRVGSFPPPPTLPIAETMVFPAFEVLTAKSVDVAVEIEFQRRLRTADCPQEQGANRRARAQFKMRARTNIAVAFQYLIERHNKPKGTTKSMFLDYQPDGVGVRSETEFGAWGGWVPLNNLISECFDPGAGADYALHPVGTPIAIAIARIGQ